MNNDPIRANLVRLIARFDGTTDPDGPVPAWINPYCASRVVLAGQQGERLPVPEAPRYEFSVYDADYVEQAGGSAPTYAQALSEGQRYLAQYQQDGPYTLELRRVEVLLPGPLPQGEVQS